MVPSFRRQELITASTSHHWGCPGMLTILIMLFIVGVLVGANALYVAGEFASVSSRRARIVQLADEGNRLARTVLPVVEDPHKLDNYIAASQVGITLSSIVLGIYGQQQIAPLIQRCH